MQLPRKTCCPGHRPLQPPETVPVGAICPECGGVQETSSGHVTRADVVDKLKRLNDLERIVPIYRQALEHIADAGGSGPWGTIADRALREALRP